MISIELLIVEACDWLFDICCFCVDGVIVIDPNGCWTCELAVGWLNVNCEGFPDCKFPKENRGTFAGGWLEKGSVEASIDEFVNCNGWVDVCENEAPNGDPVLA